MASAPSSSPPSDSGSNNSTASGSAAPPPGQSQSNQSPPPTSGGQSPPPIQSPPQSNNNSSSSSSSSSPPPPFSSTPSSGNSTSPTPPSNSNDNNNDNSSPPPPASGGNDVPSPPPPRHSPPPPRSGSLPSPPPPRSTRSSSSSSSSSDGNSESTGNNSEISSAVNIPLVVGVTAGVALFLIVMVASFLCCSRKKKKNHHEVMNYYTDPSRRGSRMNRAGDYYNTGGPPTWGPPNMDHVVKIPPPPGWHAPPPPPPMMTSSEMSSGYSGPHVPALPPPSPNLALGFNKSTFSYDELAAATGGFAQANLLGQGGFGYVHKGVLPNGKEVAVKSLKSGSGQGEREFQAEVEIISRVHHRHLVSLVGYCIAGGQRMLVYEFVVNNTLEFHLHGKDRPTMDFPTRLKIALGSAKGLAYLHEDCHPRIIHRDIKAANILLDFNFEAMVADFGLAKLSSDNNTHVSTRVMGTFGYLAPEYASSGKLSEKSDVFSFGVMLLELITGKRPVDSSLMEDSLVDWARPLLAKGLSDGNFGELVDSKLEYNYNQVEMSRMAACAAAAVRHSARRRPKMSQIVRALEGDSSLEDLNSGVRPGMSNAFSSSEGSETENISYHSQMRRFQAVAMAGEEFGGSSEYGATGEYGRDPSSHSSVGENSSSWDTGSRSNQRQRA